MTLKELTKEQIKNNIEIILKSEEAKAHISHDLTAIIKQMTAQDRKKIIKPILLTKSSKLIELIKDELESLSIEEVNEHEMLTRILFSQASDDVMKVLIPQLKFIINKMSYAAKKCFISDLLLSNSDELTNFAYDHLRAFIKNGSLEDTKKLEYLEITLETTAAIAPLYETFFEMLTSLPLNHQLQCALYLLKDTDHNKALKTFSARKILRKINTTLQENHLLLDKRFNKIIGNLLKLADLNEEDVSCWKERQKKLALASSNQQNIDNILSNLPFTNEAIASLNSLSYEQVKEDIETILKFDRPTAIYLNLRNIINKMSKDERKKVIKPILSTKSKQLIKLIKDDLVLLTAEDIKSDNLLPLILSSRASDEVLMGVIPQLKLIIDSIITKKEQQQFISKLLSTHSNPLVQLGYEYVQKFLENSELSDENKLELIAITLKTHASSEPVSKTFFEMLESLSFESLLKCIPLIVLKEKRGRNKSLNTGVSQFLFNKFVTAINRDKLLLNELNQKALQDLLKIKVLHVESEFTWFKEQLELVKSNQELNLEQSSIIDNFMKELLTDEVIPASQIDEAKNEEVLSNKSISQISYGIEEEPITDEVIEELQTDSAKKEEPINNNWISQTSYKIEEEPITNAVIQEFQTDNTKKEEQQSNRPILTTPDLIEELKNTMSISTKDSQSSVYKLKHLTSYFKQIEILFESNNNSENENTKKSFDFLQAEEDFKQLTQPTNALKEESIIDIAHEEDPSIVPKVEKSPFYSNSFNEPSSHGPYFFKRPDISGFKRKNPEQAPSDEPALQKLPHQSESINDTKIEEIPSSAKNLVRAKWAFI